jgi:DNA-binding transcriptional ArsR family regulator
LPAVPNLIRPELAIAVAHPTRLASLMILIDRPATAGEIADQLGVSRNAVTYHLKVLLRMDCVYRVSDDPSGGGRVRQHTYKAAERVYFDAASWSKLSIKEKLNVAVTLLKVISEDLGIAMAKGTFFDPDDNHISRSPINVDMEGWDEVATLLDGTVDGLFAIQDKASQRNDRSRRKVFPIKVAIIQFRSPTEG